MSMRAFDISISVGNGYTSKQYKSKASVGSDVLEKIIDKYPELNPLWLITGKGDMIIDPKSSSEPYEKYGDSIDGLLEKKIQRIVEEHFLKLSEKIDAVPSLEQISEEIKRNLKQD